MKLYDVANSASTRSHHHASDKRNSSSFQACTEDLKGGSHNAYNLPDDQDEEDDFAPLTLRSVKSAPDVVREFMCSQFDPAFEISASDLNGIRQSRHDDSMWRSIWDSFKGDSPEQTSLFLRKLDERGGDLLQIFPVMTADAADAKYNLRRWGDTIIFDTWDFKTGPMDVSGTRTPGLLNTFQRREREQGSTHYGNGFCLPLNWLNLNPKIDLYGKYISQVSENVAQTLVYQSLLTLVREARIESHRVSSTMVSGARGNNFADIVLHNWNQFGGLQKDGMGFTGLESSMRIRGKSRGVNFNTVILPSETGHLMGAALKSSYMEEGPNSLAQKRQAMWNVDDNSSKRKKLMDGAVVAAGDEPYMFHESHYFSRGHMGEQHDPLSSVSVLSQRFQMTKLPHHSTFRDEYRTSHRDIAIVNAFTYELKTIEFREAFQKSGLFKKTGPGNDYDEYDDEDASSGEYEMHRELAEKLWGDFVELTAYDVYQKSGMLTKLQQMLSADTVKNKQRLETLETLATSKSENEERDVLTDLPGPVASVDKEYTIGKLTEWATTMNPNNEDKATAIANQVYEEFFNSTGARVYRCERGKPVAFAKPNNQVQVASIDVTDGKRVAVAWLAYYTVTLDEKGDNLQRNNVNNDNQLIQLMVASARKLKNVQYLYSEIETAFQNFSINNAKNKLQGPGNNVYSGDLQNIYTLNALVSSEEVEELSKFDKGNTYNRQLFEKILKYQVDAGAALNYLSKTPSREVDVFKTKSNRKKYISHLLNNIDATSYDFWEQAMDADIPVPISFLLFRPYVRVQTGSIVFFRRGDDTAVTTIDRAGVSFKRDTASNTLFVDLHFSAALIVLDPSNTEIAHHCVVKNHYSGGGVSFYDASAEHPDRASSAEEHDLFAVAVPYDFEPANVYTDISGKLHQDIPFQAHMEREHYPTSSVYKDMWNWQPNPYEHLIDRHGRDGATTVDDVSVCVKSTQFNFDPNSQRCSVQVPGVCPVGHEGDSESYRRFFSGGSVQYGERVRRFGNPRILQ
jgi:hypothetical protein